MRGPAWVGIGAQRSGTTWLTQLLLQHPAVGLGSNGRKEQMALHLVADGRMADADYLSLFDGPGRDGEFTPFYLRSLSVPTVAARVCPPDTRFIVILRDPVERFASAMRRRSTAVPTTRAEERVARLALADTHWAGMYADQLAAWRDAVGRERLLVMTYEAATEDPQAACDRVWSALGLDPVPLEEAPEVWHATSGGEWSWPEGMREAVTRLYAPQVARLASEWELDVSPWRSFA